MLAMMVLIQQLSSCEDGMSILDTYALCSPVKRRSNFHALTTIQLISQCVTKRHSFFRWSPLPSLNEAHLATCFVWLPDGDNELPDKGRVGCGYATAAVEVLNFHNDEEKEEWRSQQDSWRASVPMLIKPMLL